MKCVVSWRDGHEVKHRCGKKAKSPERVCQLHWSQRHMARLGSITIPASWQRAFEQKASRKGA